MKFVQSIFIAILLLSALVWASNKNETKKVITAKKESNGDPFEKKKNEWTEEEYNLVKEDVTSALYYQSCTNYIEGREINTLSEIEDCFKQDWTEYRNKLVEDELNPKYWKIFNKKKSTWTEEEYEIVKKMAPIIDPDGYAPLYANASGKREINALDEVKEFYENNFVDQPSGNSNANDSENRVNNKSSEIKEEANDETEGEIEEEANDETEETGMHSTNNESSKDASKSTESESEHPAPAAENKNKAPTTGNDNNLNQDNGKNSLFTNLKASDGYDGEEAHAPWYGVISFPWFLLFIVLGIIFVGSSIIFLFYIKSKKQNRLVETNLSQNHSAFVVDLDFKKL